MGTRRKRVPAESLGLGVRLPWGRCRVYSEIGDKLAQMTSRRDCSTTSCRLDSLPPQEYDDILHSKLSPNTMLGGTDTRNTTHA